MSDPCVFIVSTIADVATDDVVRRLASRGIPFHRLNSEEYPFSRSFTYYPAPVGLVLDGTRLPSPTAVWYRRVRTPPRPEGMDEGIYTFCLQEQRASLLGSIMSMPSRWMSHPSSIWQAEYKPFQLSLAAKLGFMVPRTVITNEQETIRRAFSDFKAMVVKPTRTGHFRSEGKDFGLFTSRVLEEHLDALGSARWSPAIYQELIPKRCDVRVTIVGRQIFAAGIDSQSDPLAAIDWRQTGDERLPHFRLDLPSKITNLLLLMMDSMGLQFAAIDMIQTPTGEFVFLEVNPNGQWLWLDDLLEFGISDAVAEWLSQ
jgi:glutathione synthase/RimK-type ligase-like ATP-grasp enzyme